MFSPYMLGDFVGSSGAGATESNSLSVSAPLAVFRNVRFYGGPLDSMLGTSRMYRTDRVLILLESDKGDLCAFRYIPVHLDNTCAIMYLHDTQLSFFKATLH